MNINNLEKKTLHLVLRRLAESRNQVIFLYSCYKVKDKSYFYFAYFNHKFVKYLILKWRLCCQYSLRVFLNYGNLIQMLFKGKSRKAGPQDNVFFFWFCASENVSLAPLVSAQNTNSEFPDLVHFSKI